LGVLAIVNAENAGPVKNTGFQVAMPLEHPDYLPALQFEHRRRILDPQLVTLDAHQSIKPRKLAVAHRQHRRSRVLLTRRRTMPLLPRRRRLGVSFPSSAYTVYNVAER